MILRHPDTIGFLFARSCEPLSISGLPDGACELDILVSVGGTEYTFKSTAIGGKLSLRLNDILRNFDTPLFSPSDVEDSFVHLKMPVVAVFATYSDSEMGTWTGNCVFGGCHRPSDEIEALATGKYWWSFRPQSSLTYKFSKEFLAMARPDGGADVRIDLTLHLAQAGKVSVTWIERITPSDTILGNPSIIAIDCSYNVIRAKADELGYINDTLLAYDISGTDADNPTTADMPVGQRFIIARNDSRVRGWLFRNSLGMLDTVYSGGEVVRDINSEMTTFKTLRTIKELNNYSEEIWSVNTGYIVDKGLLQLWYEFFRSKERYAILDDGTITEIVVDELGAEHQVGQVGNMSFKCRLSKEREGYDFTKSVLEEFSDEFT